MVDRLSLIWVDGKTLTEPQSRVSLLTHALHYGTSVYDGIRFYQSNNHSYAFRLRDHINRLIYSANSLGIKVRWTAQVLEHAVIETVIANGVDEGYIRPIIFSGNGILTMETRNRVATTAIIVLNTGKYLPKQMVTLKTVSIRRPNPDAFDLKAKMGGVYVNSILAHQEAVDGGADEALMLTHDSEVAEGPGENIFIVKNDVLYTPRDSIILPGITRDSIIKICEKVGVICKEAHLKIEDVYGADECFLTGTAAEITPVAKADRVVISNKIGPLTAKFQSLFHDITRSNNDDFKSWVTLIH